MSSGWTESDYAALIKKHAPKPSKYRNQKTVIGSESYDSKREAAYHQELKIRELAGEVKEIRRQVPFQLCAVRTDLGLRPTQPIQVNPVGEYRADYVFLEHGDLVIADVKGFRTKEYQIKKRHMLSQYGIVIREVK